MGNIIGILLIIAILGYIAAKKGKVLLGIILFGLVAIGLVIAIILRN